MRPMDVKVGGSRRSRPGEFGERMTLSWVGGFVAIVVRFAEGLAIAHVYGETRG